MDMGMDTDTGMEMQKLSLKDTDMGTVMDMVVIMIAMKSPTFMVGEAIAIDTLKNLKKPQEVKLNQSELAL